MSLYLWGHTVFNIYVHSEIPMKYIIFKENYSCDFTCTSPLMGWMKGRIDKEYPSKSKNQICSWPHSLFFLILFIKLVLFLIENGLHFLKSIDALGFWHVQSKPINAA